MSGMTDKIKGSANQAVGATKKVAGRTLGDDKLEGEGAAQQVKGQVQENVGKAKVALKKMVDDA